MAWEQKLDELAAYIRGLECDLADVDALVSAHQFAIDSNPRERWPTESILGKACDRHLKRIIGRVEEMDRREKLAKR